MNAAKSLFLAVSIIAASAMLTTAQVIIELKPKAAEQPMTSNTEQDAGNRRLESHAEPAVSDCDHRYRHYAPG
jgi:hypothetical protein